jgi:hypothetical protein
MRALGRLWRRLTAGPCLCKQHLMTPSRQPIAFEFLLEADPRMQTPKLPARPEPAETLKLGMHQP